MTKAAARATNATHSPKAKTARAITRTESWKPKFLNALRERGIVKDACSAAGVNRATAYRNRDADAEFAQEWQDALDEAADELEREAWRRAVDGTDKPITFQGEVTGSYKEYSDMLLALLLRAKRSREYAERTRSEVVNLDMANLNEKQLELLASGASLPAVLAAASASGTGTSPTG